MKVKGDGVGDDHILSKALIQANKVDEVDGFACPEEYLPPGL